MKKFSCRVWCLRLLMLTKINSTWKIQNFIFPNELKQVSIYNAKLPLFGRPLAGNEVDLCYSCQVDTDFLSVALPEWLELCWEGLKLYSQTFSLWVLWCNRCSFTCENAANVGLWRKGIWRCCCSRFRARWERTTRSHTLHEKDDCWRISTVPGKSSKRPNTSVNLHCAMNLSGLTLSTFPMYWASVTQTMLDCK